jgi:hypothetical protein
MHGAVECNWVDGESDEEVSEGNKTNCGQQKFPSKLLNVRWVIMQ